MSSNAINQNNYTLLDKKLLLDKIDNAKERVIILLQAFILYEPIYSDIIKYCRIIEIIASKIRVFIMTNISEWSNLLYAPKYRGIDDELDIDIQKFANTIKLPNNNTNYKFNINDRSQELYLIYDQEYKHLVKEIIRLKFEKYKKEIEGYNFYGDDSSYDIEVIKDIKYWLSNLTPPLYKNIKEINKELNIKKKEYKRLQETKKKIQEQLHLLVKMPSRLLGRFMTSSKKLNTEEKINIWSDKIIEMISDVSVRKSDKCIEKISIDIINSFVERPNTMIYNITFTDKELEHPEYLKLLEDYKKIITVLQNMKLDDCKNS